MKALTVQQPWAWAIVHGGKDVENRTQSWSYRGPLAIHAGARLSERGLTDRRVLDAATVSIGLPPGISDGPIRMSPESMAAFIGLVDLVDVHVARMLDYESGCCDPWGEQSYPAHGGRTRRDVVHLVLENPRPLDRPIRCAGKLGLWTPPAEVLDELREAL